MSNIHIQRAIDRVTKTRDFAKETLKRIREKQPDRVNFIEELKQHIEILDKSIGYMTGTITDTLEEIDNQIT